MGIRIEDNGLDLALSGLSGVRAERAVTATAFELAKRAKAATPRGDGSLVGSIRTEANGESGVVGYGAEYAPHVEFGHRQNVGQYVEKLGKRLVRAYVPGQHFFRRAVVETKGEMGRVLKKVVEEAER